MHRDFPSSDSFSHALHHTHEVVVECDIVDSTGRYVIDHLDVIDGSVSVDASRKTVRQCNITIQDPTGSIVPDNVNSMIQPFSGNYIRLRRGIRYNNGNTELYALGTFAPWSPRVVDTDSSLEISVDGYDRSMIISKTRWTKPYSITSGTNLATAIRNILDSRMSNLKYSLAPSNRTVPAVTLGLEMEENDPWEDAVKIANADGMDLYIDADDVVTLAPISDPGTSHIVKTYVDDESCVVTRIERTTDASHMYTGVIVYGEGSEVIVPIRVELWRSDTNLRIPYFFPTSLIKNEAQALATAQSLLHNVIHSELTVNINAIPDPRHEIGDVIHIIRERSKIDNFFVIDSISMPLGIEGEMTLSTKSIRFP